MTGRHRSCSVAKDLLKFEIEPDPGQSALVQRDDAQVESSLKLRWLCGPDHQGDGEAESIPRRFRSIDGCT